MTMRLALAVITATVAGLIAVESVSAQGVLPPSAPPAHEATEKGDKQKGVLPPGAAAPLPPPPAAGKDGGDKLGALKELDKAGAAGGRLPLSEYKFPGLIGAVFEGKLEDVPDDKATRVVVFSIVQRLCGFLRTDAGGRDVPRYAVRHRHCAAVLPESDRGRLQAT
jgi:hypothetical protein